MFLRYLSFCLDFFGHEGKRLFKKRLLSKFMTASTGKQKITIHILSNISKGKDDQKMKFGQLIEYSMRNIFI